MSANTKIVMTRKKLKLCMEEEVNDDSWDWTKLKLCMQKDIDDNIRDWTGVPDGILMLIVEKLNLSDSLSFCNTCKSWRSAVREVFSNINYQSSRVPWLVMSGQNRSETRTCFSTIEKKVFHMKMPGRFLWGSFQDWLIMIEPPKNPDGKYYKKTPNGKYYELFVFNPFSGHEVVLPKMKDYRFRKLVFSGSPCEQSTIYMLIGLLDTEFALWTPGIEDWYEWGEKKYDVYRDGVFCDGYFYIMDMNFNIRQIEIALPLCARGFTADNIRSKFYRFGKPDYGTCGFYSHLVESSGEILLVIRLNKRNDEKKQITYSFKVFRMNLTKMAWVKVEDLGDQVLFVGRNCSTSAFAKELGAEMENCIYFTNEYKSQFANEWNYSMKGSDINDWGVYRLVSGNGNDSGDISYPTIEGKWGGLWISAPMWWYCQDIYKAFLSGNNLV